ncbi:MAG: hypothetical protein AB4426_10700 [Xenococcaceae cyanobacterium]
MPLARLVRALDTYSKHPAIRAYPHQHIYSEIVTVHSPPKSDRLSVAIACL